MQMFTWISLAMFLYTQNVNKPVYPHKATIFKIRSYFRRGQRKKLKCWKKMPLIKNIYTNCSFHITGMGRRCVELSVLCLTVYNKSTWTTAWTCLQRSDNFRQGGRSSVPRWYSIHFIDDGCTALKVLHI